MADNMIAFVKRMLVRYNKDFATFGKDEFITFGYIGSEEDGLGLVHSYGIHSFKTFDGFAAEILERVADDYGEATEKTIRDWFKDNFSYNEEAGKYIAYIDVFEEGSRKSVDKLYDRVNAAGDDMDAVDAAVDDVYDNETDEDKAIWQIHEYLENQNINFAKLKDNDFITIAYIHTTDDGMGMMTTGGYTNCKTFGDACECIFEKYEEENFGEDLEEWYDENIVLDANKPGKIAVFIRSFED